MKTEKEEEEYKVKMEELKNFLFLVNVYTSEFYAGFKLSEVISKLDDEILVYEYNKELNIEDLKPLCGFIKKDLKLNDRNYKCDKCGLEIDRDYNASINLSNYSRA